MKLRLRLALTVVAVSVPMVAGLGYVQHSLRQRNQAEVLEASTLARMQAGERERCEAQPETWRTRRGGPPRPEVGAGPRGPDRPEGPGGPGVVTHFAYDAQLESSNPHAPLLSESVRREALEGRTSVVRRTARNGESQLDVLVRMPWSEGPCAFVLARRLEPRGPPLGGMPPPEVLAIPFLAVLAMVVALGPMVRRVRQLTSEVRASASSRYVEPVRVRGGNDEVTELARAFQEARAEIQHQLSQQEAREQALRDFLANTTHDVMTPLTVLQGHLSTLQQRLRRGEALAPSVVGDAMGEAHYIASLVHNLAAAARLDAGQPQAEFTAVDLNAVIARVLGRHQPIARQQRIALESGVPEAAVWVHGDVTLIEQAVSNIVFNGIHHGCEDGHVAVVLEHSREKRFRLRVIDDGPGIPEAERARLMERRFRGNAARTRGLVGQGLGLHITQHVAQVHGWALTLAASEYGGLEVMLEGSSST